jgi:hypothetical protein
VGHDGYRQTVVHYGDKANRRSPQRYGTSSRPSRKLARKVLKMLKKVNKKRRKMGILRVSRHLEVMLSLVLLMREK